jgi:Aspartyl protease
VEHNNTTIIEEQINNIENNKINKTNIMSTRCKVKIGKQEIWAIPDTGAATCIITKSLIKDLGLRIIDASNARFNIANGQSVAALGKVMVEMEIEGKKIKEEMDVIDSKRKDLILGTELLAKTQGEIDYENRELRMNIGNKRISTPIYFLRQEKEEDSEEEETDNDNYEEVENKDLYEQESEDSDEEIEYEQESKSAAYYLTELI